MTPPARSRILLGAIALQASLLVTHAQEKAPPRLAEDVVLSTKTPLGEASISLAEGSEVTDFSEEGDAVRLQQGPFTATVPRAQLDFGADVTVAPEAAPVEDAPASPPPTPVPVANTAEPVIASPWEDILAEWKTYLPIAAAVLLGVYALFVTLALSRLRRREAGKARTPRPALPAVVTGDGNSIACPLCGKDIAVERLKSGRNNCPVCRGAFEVERP